MKLDELVNFVEKFILDIIGVIFPGAILLIGLAVTVNPSFLERQWLWVQLSTTGKWVMLVCLAYVSGHGLHVVGEKILLPVFEYLRTLQAKFRAARQSPKGTRFKTLLKSLRDLLSGAEKRKRSSHELQSSSEFLSFKKVFETTYNMVLSDEHGKSDFHPVRNLAMSVAPEVGPLTYKFMFISLMNLGVATAVFLTGIAFVVIHSPMAQSSLFRFILVAFSLLVLIPYLFLLKHSEFHKRAMTVPFASAIVKLFKENNDNQVDKGNSNLKQLGFQENPRRPIVYLAGGFVSGWQDIIMAQCPEANYLDPRSHGLEEPRNYTAWDLQAIRESDIVFAVLEASNPGGYALALEVGYAKSRGKYVVLVDEKSAFDPSLIGYLAMLHSVSDETYYSFDDGVRAFIRTLNVLKAR